MTWTHVRCDHLFVFPGCRIFQNCFQIAPRLLPDCLARLAWRINANRNVQCDLESCQVQRLSFWIIFGLPLCRGSEFVSNNIVLQMIRSFSSDTKCFQPHTHEFDFAKHIHLLSTFPISQILFDHSIQFCCHRSILL